MGLVVSTAFQMSPYIQSRAFTVLGVLSDSDVDDDLLYQVMVALRNAASAATLDDYNLPYIVSILRCITNIVPAMIATSRYMPQLFWLPVALLQSPYATIYVEALKLLHSVLTVLVKDPRVARRGLSTCLLNCREPLLEATMHLDAQSGLSFDEGFSFALAALILRGFGVSQVQDLCTTTLRLLLRLSVGTSNINGSMRTIPSEAAPYMLVLFAMTAQTTAQAEEILRAAGLNPADHIRAGEMESPENARVLFPVKALGNYDQQTAMMLCALSTLMVSQSLGDRGLTNRVVTDVASKWPETATMVCAYRSVPLFL